MPDADARQAYYAAFFGSNPQGTVGLVKHLTFPLLLYFLQSREEEGRENRGGKERGEISSEGRGASAVLCWGPSTVWLLESKFKHGVFLCSPRNDDTNIKNRLR